MLVFSERILSLVHLILNYTELAGNCSPIFSIITPISIDKVTIKRFNNMAWVLLFDCV